MNGNVRASYSNSAVPKKPGPKGHDSVLKALQDNKRQTTIITTGGDLFTGTITGRDKFTITLAVKDSDGICRHVFYKHAIERFYGEEPATTTSS